MAANFSALVPLGEEDASSTKPSGSWGALQGSLRVAVDSGWTASSCQLPTTPAPHFLA